MLWYSTQRLSLFFIITIISIITIFIIVLGLAFGSSMTELVFVGMVGIIDPLREGVRESVEILLSSGVGLKMVTGDAEETALAIGML